MLSAVLRRRKAIVTGAPRRSVVSGFDYFNTLIDQSSINARRDYRQRAIATAIQIENTNGIIG